MAATRLIVYASKSGTVAACAKELAALLPNTELIDLHNGIPYILDQKTVIIGGSIRMGTLHRLAKKFIVQNKTSLFRCNLGIFICNGILAQADDLLGANVPPGILKHAAVISSFGGNCDPAIQHGLDRIIMKKMMAQVQTNKNFKEPHILHGVIRRFAEEIVKEEAKAEKKEQASKNTEDAD